MKQLFLFLIVLICSCQKEISISKKELTSAKKPTSYPTVSIFTPHNGDIVTDFIKVQINASSSVGIKNTSLMFTVGTFNCFYGNDNTAPYVYSWNTSVICDQIIPSGTKVTIRASATDNNNKISYTDISVIKK